LRRVSACSERPGVGLLLPEVLVRALGLGVACSSGGGLLLLRRGGGWEGRTRRWRWRRRRRRRRGGDADRCLSFFPVGLLLRGHPFFAPRFESCEGFERVEGVLRGGGSVLRRSPERAGGKLSLRVSF